MDEFVRDLEQRLAPFGVYVGDQTLWQLALTHKSRAHEEGETAIGDNERLEFLGDAVVDLAVSEWLYAEFPGSPEGELAKMRAAVVCADGLAQAARLLRLGECMRLGHGEEKSGGRSRTSLLSNVFEAIVGAIYLDQGWQTAKSLVVKVLAEQLAGLFGDSPNWDPKSRLQESLQAESKEAPTYRLVEESGPDHQKLFISEVVHKGAVLGRGRGRSKKASEQAAAAQALENAEE